MQATHAAAKKAGSSFVVVLLGSSVAAGWATAGTRPPASMHVWRGSATAARRVLRRAGAPRVRGRGASRGGRSGRRAKNVETHERSA